MDYWKIKFKNICVWSYFRPEFNKYKTSSFKPKLTISKADIFGFFQFISLFYKNNKTVVFISGRKELIDFVEGYFSEEIIVFTRSENVKGNAFFIEIFRYLFQKLAWVFCPIEYRGFCQSVIAISSADKSLTQKYAKKVIGDYYWNIFLTVFLKGNRVYFSNCVIPLIERFENRHSSTEIQHGVIHKDHFDYSNLPPKLFKVKMLVWNLYWEKKLLQNCNFFGDVLVGNYEPKFNNQNNCDNKKLIYTTVSELFSDKIIEYSLISNESIFVQKHTRDYFDYSSALNIISFIKEANPRSASKVYIHDSTIIKSLVDENVKFYYVKLDNETNESVIENLLEKYNAVNNVDFFIVDKL